MANDIQHGLVYYNYTKGLSKIIYLSEKLEFAIVDINNIAGTACNYLKPRLQYCIDMP